MALLVMEGFDWADDYTDLSIKSGMSPNASDGYIGTDTGYGNVGKCLTLTYYRQCVIAFGKIIDGDEIIIGYAVKYPGTPDSASNGVQICSYNGYQLCFNWTSGWGLTVRRGDYNDTVIAESDAGILSADQWGYVEIKALIDNSAGYVIVNVNGIEIINETGLDTQYRTESTASYIRLHDNQNGLLSYDDIYICDNTGTKNNDFLGPCKVTTLFPSGAGNYSQFTPSGEASNYLCVDDSSGIDDDTTYVGSAVTNAIDTYVFGDVDVTGGTIFGVSVQPCLKLEEGGSRTYKGLVRDGGVDYPCSGEKYPVAEYKCHSWVLEDHPAGGDWTEASVNSSEFGIKIMS